MRSLKRSTFDRQPLAEARAALHRSAVNVGASFGRLLLCLRCCCCCHSSLCSLHSLRGVLQLCNRLILQCITLMYPVTNTEPPFSSLAVDISSRMPVLSHVTACTVLPHSQHRSGCQISLYVPSLSEGAEALRPTPFLSSAQ